jgi:hypothetical protein
MRYALTRDKTLVLKTKFSRREMLAIVGTLPALTSAVGAAAQPANSQRALPDRANFAFEGIYLDAAFTHPLIGVAFAAGSDYLSLRRRDPQGVSPRGTAFLYVWPESLQRLKRVEVGWRQVRNQQSHILPLEPPGPVLGSYELAADVAGLFEVSTPAWGPLATVAASLDYIEALGVDTIARYRQPLLDRIQAELPQHGFEALTPLGSRSPIVAYACKDASKRFAARLQAEHIQISVYENRIRISPSVYNTMDDVEHLLKALLA